MSTEGENAPLLLPAFTRATGIPVDVQALPWTAAHEKVLTAFAGGSMPDVLMVKNDWLAELAMLGAIGPMPVDLTTGWLPAARDAASVDRHLVGVPWTIDTQVQFYRRDLLADVGFKYPPAKWSDWRQMAIALKRRRPDDFAVLLLLDWPEQLFTFAAQQPEPMLRDGATRGNFSTVGFRNALAFYTSLFAEKLAPAIVGAQVGDSLTSFARGTFAILPSSAETVGDLARRTAQLARAAWATAEMPRHDDAARCLVAGSSLIVSHTARDPAKAWQLVRYLTAPATQAHLYSITGNLPTRPSVWDDTSFKRNPVAASFGRQIARGIAAPAVPEWARITVEVQQVAERTVRGEFTVDAATVEMDRRVDAILAKRRHLLNRGRAA